MKISTKGRYALRAMIELASGEPGRPLLGRDIAAAQEIPLDYLEQIFVRLRRTKLVRTMRGAGGGYFLGKKPEDINALEIVEAAEGSLLPLDCLRNGGKCRRAKDCVARTLWQDAGKAMRQVLEDTTLADLRDRQAQL